MNKAEEKFKEWLDRHGYGFLYIDQASNTFAEFFRDISKRPDFLVVIKQIGIIAIDVKDKYPHPEKKDYILDEEKEVKKLLEFERITKIPVWFVFGSEQDGYKSWRWISLSSVLESRLQTNQERGHFRAIDPDHCKLLSSSDKISRILD